jgi:hypothetical protein
VTAVLGKFELYHYSGSHFYFFVVVAVNRFFSIKYFIVLTILADKKAAVTQN